MKKLFIALTALLFLLCACSSIDSIEIPEPSPSSQTPIESEEPIATSTPEPSKPDPESVPKRLEEMSNRIGMRVFQPIKLPDGYALTQIGYDGDNTAALKYTSDAGTLLYTFYPSTSSVPKDSEQKIVSGFTAYYTKTDLSSIVQWSRGGCTYQIISEPAMSFEELEALLKEMLKGPSLSENEIDVEIENMESLSKKTGFKVWEPTYIPEGFKLSTLSCYRLYTASIKYISESDMITFRACEGEILPYYDKKDLGNPTEASVANMEVNFYMNKAGKVVLCEWTNKGYAHQILSENGASVSTMEMMVVGFSK